MKYVPSRRPALLWFSWHLISCFQAALLSFLTASVLQYSKRVRFQELHEKRFASKWVSGLVLNMYSRRGALRTCMKTRAFSKEYPLDLHDYLYSTRGHPKALHKDSFVCKGTREAFLWQYQYFVKGCIDELREHPFISKGVSPGSAWKYVYWQVETFRNYSNMRVFPEGFPLHWQETTYMLKGCPWESHEAHTCSKGCWLDLHEILCISEGCILRHGMNISVFEWRDPKVCTETNSFCERQNGSPC